VFASGILVGAVSQRLYTTSAASANSVPRTAEEWRKHYLAEMKQRVKVSDEQIAKIVPILDDTKRRFDELHAQEKPAHDRIQQEHIAQIKAVLNDEQKIAYDNWREERERKKKAQQQK
jgi:predicted secreted Zn-dependent protease